MTIKIGSVPMIFNHQRFGNDCLARRLHLRMKVSDIADLIETSASVISRYERGTEPNLHMNVFLKMCNVFDLDPREYFELEH